jgi:diguanylate cyclase (GGDEF)-like protein/PAS domain S-box-containing protein
MNIGIMTPFLDGHLFGGILYHINQLAKSLGHQVIAVKTPYRVNQYDKPLATKHVDGWIVTQTEPHELVRLEWNRLGKPMVGVMHQSALYPCVDFDPCQGISLSMEHLIQKGRTRIAFIGNLNNSTTQQRYQAYQDALRLHGISFDPSLVDDIGQWSQSGGYLAADRFIQGDWRPDAVISSGLCAMAIAERLTESGVVVTDELQIISWDGLPQLADCVPPISDAEASIQEIAECSLGLLLDLIAKKEAPPPLTIVPSKLTIRGSCGSPADETDMAEPNTKLFNAFNRLSIANNINHRIMLHLGKGAADKLKSLSWLDSSIYSWGCLGYWKKSQAQLHDPYIQVENYYTPFSSQPSEEFEGQASEYPPIHLIPESAYLNKDYILTLLPSFGDGKEYGVMALVQKIDESGLYFKSHTTTTFLNGLCLALDRAEFFDQVQHSKHMMETISNATTDVTFEWSLQNKTIQWSQRAYDILGTAEPSEDWLLGIIHPEDRPGVLTAVHEHIDYGTMFRVECRLKHLSGEYLWVEWNGQVMRDPENRPLRMIGSLRNISERKLAEQQVGYLAYHDVLTGLRNRAFMYEYLPKQLNQAASKGAYLGIVLLDLDKFKDVNDIYGHEAGDELLKYIAMQLQQAVGSEGTVVRLAGDEFIVIVERMQSREHISQICESILHNMRNSFFYKHAKIDISGSIGISLYPEHGSTMDELIKNADNAMYQVKAGGRDRYMFY